MTHLPLALQNVLDATAQALELQLANKSKTFSQLIGAIEAARTAGHSHKQIHAQIFGGGLNISYAHYASLYFRTKGKSPQKHIPTKIQERTPDHFVIQPVPIKHPNAPPNQDQAQTGPIEQSSGLVSTSDELRRVRSAGRIDYSKLIKQRDRKP